MTERSNVTAIVLAAGRGKRLKSDVPKVLHKAAGRPLVAHVVAALQRLEPAHTVVVTSAQPERFRAALSSAGLEDGITFAVQDPPRGTGDAVRVALAELEPVEGTVMIANGDTPMITGETFEGLLRAHVTSGAAATVLTSRTSDARGLGRIVRGRGDEIDEIVEEVDATDEQRAIDEINGGVFVFDAARLHETLGKVDKENAQGEYYLTDVIALLRSRGETAIAFLADEDEVAGVNDRAQLAAVTRALRERSCAYWMSEGVTIIDPATTYIDAGVRIGRDATILPFTFLEGDTSVGSNAEVGPQTRVVDSEIGAGASVTYAVVKGSTVGPEASVGPYASLRQGTRLGPRARVGTFVETKNTTLGEDTKANHLAYLGDADIGRGVNVGAGTITCNWDGTSKHKTTIDDDAYIASDTMLVAPVHIGKRAATGAGSVVRDDVPDDALAVGVPARIIPGKGNKMDRPRNDAGEIDEEKKES